MVDPTWIRTCPCGEKVRVNQMGQHHHTACQFQTEMGTAANLWSTPSCCPQPSISRVWYNEPDAGTRCENCGETWGTGDPDAQIQAMADYLTPDFTFEFPEARGEGYRSIERALRRELNAL